MSPKQTPVYSPLSLPQHGTLMLKPPPSQHPLALRRISCEAVSKMRAESSQVGLCRSPLSLLGMSLNTSLVQQSFQERSTYQAGKWSSRRAWK